MSLALQGVWERRLESLAACATYVDVQEGGMTSDWAISTLHSLLDHRVSIRFKASARYALGVADSDCSGFLDASPFDDGLRFRLLSDRPTQVNAVTVVPYFDPRAIEIEEIALLLSHSAQPECIWNAAHPTGRDLPRLPEPRVLV